MKTFFLSVLISSLALFQTHAIAQSTLQKYEVARDSASYYILKKKDYPNALRCYKISFSEGNTRYIDYYNAACSAAKLGKKQEAFQFLEAAIQQGYLNEQWANKDSDFDSLRGEKQWENITKSFAQARNAIEKKFAKLEHTAVSDLIPYRVDGKWGYVSASSLEIVVLPVFQHLDFMRSEVIVRYVDDCHFVISKHGKLTEVIYPGSSENYGYLEPPIHQPKRNPDPEFKGFTLDENNKIATYSSLYIKDDYWHHLNIQGPFKIKDQYYAVARKGNSAGIIDQNGNHLEGFDFNYKNLVFNSEGLLETWFYYEDKAGEKGFINNKSKKMLGGELLSSIDSYSNLSGLNIQQKDGLYGILDLYRMEWLIKPQKLKITKIDYANQFFPPMHISLGVRETQNYYFLVEEADGRKYYIDDKAKAYLPKGK